jgi:hypothetical protein
VALHLVPGDLAAKTGLRRERAAASVLAEDMAKDVAQPEAPNLSVETQSFEGLTTRSSAADVDLDRQGPVPVGGLRWAVLDTSSSNPQVKYHQRLRQAHITLPKSQTRHNEKQACFEPHGQGSPQLFGEGVPNMSACSTYTNRLAPA